MRAVALPITLLVACCNSQANVEQQFELAVNTGTYADACAAARRAAQAHLERGDQESFNRWRLIRDVYCAAALRDPNGTPPRDARTPPDGGNSL